MNKDQIKKVEEEAARQYDYSTELVDSSHTNFEHTNKIHTIRCQRAFIKGAQFGYKMAGEWVKFADREPEKICETPGNFIAPYLFEIEISDGVEARRLTIAAYYLFGDVQKWCIPYLCQPIEEVLGNVKYLRWINTPTPPTFSDEG